MDHISHYLNQFSSLPLPSDFPSAINGSNIVVIPSREENQALMECLDSIESASQFSKTKNIAVIVINGSEKSFHANQLCFQLIKKTMTASYESSPFFIFNKSPSLDVLVIDAFSFENSMTEKQGVGTARKIGADIALQLIDKKQIEKEWIFNTDADALLPKEYFNGIPEGHSFSGAIYDFSHLKPADALEAQAIEHYEAYLRFYVAGLKFAGSPYAYQTIGSTLAIHASAYAQVRGFPEKLAGEDFHMISKLAKLKPLNQLESKILLSSRISNRTPFGTGQSIATICEIMKQRQKYLVYNPLVFQKIRLILSALRELSQSSLFHFPASFEKIESWGIISQPRIFHLHQNFKKPELRLRAFNEYFDALKTLRTIHKLTELEAPKIPLDEAISELGKLSNIPNDSRILKNSEFNHILGNY